MVWVWDPPSGCQAEGRGLGADDGAGETRLLQDEVAEHPPVVWPDAAGRQSCLRCEIGLRGGDRVCRQGWWFCSSFSKADWPRRDCRCAASASQCWFWERCC